MMSKSSTTTRSRQTEKDLLPLVTPGEILQEEFLQPMGLSVNALASALHVPPNRIWEIVKNRRGITADTALRLGQYFGNTPEFWMNLQQNYDLARARRESLADIQHQITRRPPAREEPLPKAGQGRLRSGD
jgi:antitoxin HigA-1